MNSDLKTITVSRKTGEEEFTFEGKPTGTNLQAFWKWYASDLVSNALRGVLAEYIVAMAVNQTEAVRLEWDAIDLKTKSGIKIEVKSAAYIQSWAQKDYSKISFGIAPTKGWNAKTNEYSNERKRQADVYVFCVLKTKDQDKINPLDFDQWDFYVLPTRVLDMKIPKQKTITLNSLLKLNPSYAEFKSLELTIDMVTFENPYKIGVKS